MSDKPIFDKLREFKRRWSKSQRAVLLPKEVEEFNRTLAEARKPVPAPVPAPAPTAPPTGAKGPLVAIVGAVAATSLFASIPEDEGLAYQAYRDIAGIWTICYGDTANVRPGMRETPEGCLRRLEAQLVAHAKPVMQCTPRLQQEGRDLARAAAVSLAYNIGVRAYCRSTVDRRFDAGQWQAGCDAFLMWNKARVGGQLRPVRGLTLRRQRERELCLRSIA